MYFILIYQVLLMNKKRILSGIQPSGIIHLGNYFGAIAQYLELQDENESFIFIANYHNDHRLHISGLMLYHIYKSICH